MHWKMQGGRHTGAQFTQLRSEAKPGTCLSSPQERFMATELPRLPPAQVALCRMPWVPFGQLTPPLPWVGGAPWLLCLLPDPAGAQAPGCSPLAPEAQFRSTMGWPGPHKVRVWQQVLVPGGGGRVERAGLSRRHLPVSLGGAFAL